MTKFDADNLPLRECYSPSDEDRARVQKALGVQLGVGVFGAAEVLSQVGGAGTSQAPSAATLQGASTSTTGSVLQAGLSGKVLLVSGASTLAIALGLGLATENGPTQKSEAAQVPAQRSSAVGGVGTSEEEPPNRAPPGQPIVSTSTENVVIRGEPESEPESIESGSHGPTSPGRRPAQASSAVEGTLGRETALLAGASQALREGKPQEAEQVLDRHAAEFGQGSLAPEREGLRLLSSCQAQLTPALLREVSRFVATYPQSPLVKHLRMSCREEAKVPQVDQSTRRGAE